jgi:hypothetical protein
VSCHGFARCSLNAARINDQISLIGATDPRRWAPFAPIQRTVCAQDFGGVRCRRSRPKRCSAPSKRPWLRAWKATRAARRSGRDEDLNVIADRFDLALAWSVFAHMPKMVCKELIAGIGGLLCPGGTFLFTFNEGPEWQGPSEASQRVMTDWPAITSPLSASSPRWCGGFDLMSPDPLLWQIREALGFCFEAPFRLNRSGEDGADRVARVLASFRGHRARARSPRSRCVRPVAP